MSCVYKGQVIESELSANSNGGTEQMRKRLIDNANPDLLKDVAVHFSRPREVYDDVPNIFYCHDLAEDPENKILVDGGWKMFDHFVFVSAWQRDQYIVRFGIPYSKCSVIPNAIEKSYQPPEKNYDKIRFIYHTTPHRGLELLVPIFDALTKEFDNIHLDVYSGFEIYGWEQRNAPYQGVLDNIRGHENMTYHGVKSNEEVLEALDKAHIFLYPNIWKETSCIALIEAVRSGVLCIHPNHGALPETSGNATVMYDYTENTQDHANFAYSVARQVLQNQKEDPNFLQRLTTSDRYALGRNSINSFTNSWNKILRDVGENAK